MAIFQNKLISLNKKIWKKLKLNNKNYEFFNIKKILIL